MLRWLSRSRQSMQRLGFSKLAVLIAPETASSGELAQRMKEVLDGHHVAAQPSAELTDWLSKGRRGLKAFQATGKIALQDYFVLNHPSKTGWLSRDGFNEYAEYLPRRLFLLDDIFRRTEMGDLLVDHLLRDVEKRLSPDAGDSSNILMLDVRQRILFLHQLLLADGDFLVPFIGALADEFDQESFNYLDAGNLLPSVCRRVSRTFLEHAYSLEDREILRKLESTAHKIEQQAGEAIETKGSGSRREQTSIPRLEWLVDLGFAERRPVNGSTRVFAFTEQGRKFASVACAAYEQQRSVHYADKAMVALLDEQFYGIVNAAYFGSLATEAGEEDVLQFLTPAYEQLTSLRGYYLFRPLLLLANVDALTSSTHPRFFEYAKALDLLETLYRESPDRVTYSIDRFSTDYQIRIT